MNIFEGVEINTIQFIGPILVLAAILFALGFIWFFLFEKLPKFISNFLFGCTMLSGCYIWFYPMNMGFYEFFK
ncbi:hypothetical protein AC625_06490 [Peribacillus loiseleuriae]|uniref:Uncharacterized protein n=1 Tax=Peribacillus loiseleuriae TaxID=1679170 RepID=A0A0K9GRF5_9BACI|nr:hypothetical protein AC625_06490 [Peribacillus loiseleuriae]